jgi:hypothetical protein
MTSQTGPTSGAGGRAGGRAGAGTVGGGWLRPLDVAVHAARGGAGPVALGAARLLPWEAPLGRPTRRWLALRNEDGRPVVGPGGEPAQVLQAAAVLN